MKMQELIDEASVPVFRIRGFKYWSFPRRIIRTGWGKRLWTPS